MLCPRHIKGGMNDATAGQPTTAEHWLTYADAAERLGLTLEAVRALARRQHWQRRSPNAVGGQTWILVPADRLVAAANGGHTNGERRAPRNDKRRAHSDEIAPPASQDDDGRRATPAATPDTDEPLDRRAEDSDRRLDEVLTAVREVGELFAPLRDQLDRERQRADRAENRVQEVEKQLAEMRDKLETEMIEHRRIVGTLTEQLAARRSWRWWRR